MSKSSCRRELFSLISWHMHRTEHCPYETIERLFLKATGVELGNGGFNISEKYLRLGFLFRCRQDMHDGDIPKNEKAPPVLLRYNRMTFLIDGQKRINKWRDDKNNGPFRCLILTVKKESADELPDAKIHGEHSGPVRGKPVSDSQMAEGSQMVSGMRR